MTGNRGHGTRNQESGIPGTNCSGSEEEGRKPVEIGARAAACGLVGLWLLTELTPGLSRAPWGPGKNEETLLPFLCVSQSQSRLHKSYSCEV